jgi:hypothetical protein
VSLLNSKPEVRFLYRVPSCPSSSTDRATACRSTNRISLSSRLQVRILSWVPVTLNAAGVAFLSSTARQMRLWVVGNVSVYIKTFSRAMTVRGLGNDGEAFQSKHALDGVSVSVLNSEPGVRFPHRVPLSKSWFMVLNKVRRAESSLYTLLVYLFDRYVLFNNGKAYKPIAIGKLVTGNRLSHCGWEVRYLTSLISLLKAVRFRHPLPERFVRYLNN